jgi:hypothetical protein
MRLISSLNRRILSDHRDAHADLETGQYRAQAARLGGTKGSDFATLPDFAASRDLIRKWVAGSNDEIQDMGRVGDDLLKFLNLRVS